MTIETKPYIRKSFEVEAVQITAENMDEVAKWCRGSVVRSEEGQPAKRPYVSLKAGRGYEGDWACSKLGNFRLYTRRAFLDNFESALSVAAHEDDHPVLFNAEDSSGRV